jgi:peptidyl-prolyl cis-trans isomerase D
MNVLKTLRSMGFLKILLWIIVISFIGAMFTLWGGGLDAEKSSGTLLGNDYAVKVGKESFPPAVFRLQYRFYVERLRNMFGDSFNEQFLRGAPQNIANQMAQQLIQARMAKAYGLSVSDQELATSIQKIYNFKNPKTEYPAMLSRMGVSAVEFQEFFRNELLVQKLNNLISDTVFIPEVELKKSYVEENEKAKAMVVLVPASNFTAMAGSATTEEIKAKYEKEKATLTTPEKRGIEYVFVNPTEMRNTIKVDESQVKAYYQAHIADFGTEAGKRRASHVLIRVTEDAKPEVAEAARKKAEMVYEKAKAGADFSALARDFSEDPSAKSGGDLGWFNRQMMVKPFADAVFDQCKAVGDVVGPIRTQFGYHVIKLTGIGGQPRPFDEVKEQVKQTMLLQDPVYQAQAKKLVEDAKKAISDAKGEADIKAAADKYGVKIAPLSPFAKGDIMGPLGRDPKIEAAVFKTEKDKWSEPIQLRDGLVRFKVTSETPSHPATLEEVQTKLGQEVVHEKAMALARTAAFTLAQSAKDAAALEAAAKKENFNAQQSQALKKGDSIPGVGKDEALNKALLEAKPDTLVGPVETATGWVVAFVTEHDSADMKKYAETRDQFAQQQRQKAAQDIINDYVQQEQKALEAAKEIHFNTTVIKQMEPTGGGEG